jgi:hypothetical protein
MHWTNHETLLVHHWIKDHETLLSNCKEMTRKVLKSNPTISEAIVRLSNLLSSVYAVQVETKTLNDMLYNLAAIGVDWEEISLWLIEMVKEEE